MIFLDMLWFKQKKLNNQLIQLQYSFSWATLNINQTQGFWYKSFFSFSAVWGVDTAAEDEQDAGTGGQHGQDDCRHQEPELKDFTISR